MPQLKVTASSLNVREAPSLQGVIIGSLAHDTVVEQLDVSDDQQWLKVQKGDLVGWSSHRHLLPLVPDVDPQPRDRILQIAGRSAIATYHWSERGVAPRGYIKGMALVFARAYCRLREHDAYALEMAKANRGDPASDALSHYEDQFHQRGMDNEAAGVDTLRHLFVLLLGLGMRESSGRWCEGRDLAADNTTSETAEAGLFQTSWNARSASPLLPRLFADYQRDPAGLLEVFQEGVTVRPTDLRNFGTGEGEVFQGLSKHCPAFAVEFAAIGLRHMRKHWGPINRHDAELRPEADRMFLRVQQEVDSCDLCDDLH